MALNRWEYERLLSELRSFLEESFRVKQHDNCLRSIREQLAAPNWRKLFGGYIDEHTDWIIAKALSDVADGQVATGWSLLRSGLHWRYWNYWIGIETNCHSKPSRRGCSWPLGGILEEELGFLFCHAYGTWDDEIAQTVGEWLTWGLDDKGVRQWGWRWPIHTFFLELYRRTSGRSVTPPRDLPPMGPYQGVFDFWNSPSAFADAIHIVCDYHCERTVVEVNDESDEPNYFGYPEKMLPVEILAIKRMREEEGLEFPQTSHPLLDTPWWRTVPSTPAEFSDPLLDDVRSCFPLILSQAARHSR